MDKRRAEAQWKWREKYNNVKWEGKRKVEQGWKRRQKRWWK